MDSHVGRPSSASAKSRRSDLTRTVGKVAGTKKALPRASTSEHTKDTILSGESAVHDVYVIADGTPPPEAATDLGNETDVIGYFEEYCEGRAKGWAIDPTAPQIPASVHAVIDGVPIAKVHCNLIRPDVESRLAPGHPGPVGFEYDVPEHYLDGKPHTIAFATKERRKLKALGHGTTRDAGGEEVFCDLVRYEVLSSADGWRQGALQGWVLRKTRLGAMIGGNQLAVYSNGVLFAQARADHPRNDVAAEFGCSAFCGFKITIPRSKLRPGIQEFRFYLMPERIELAGSPVRTGIIDDALERDLLDVAAAVDSALDAVTDLRRRLALLTTRPAASVIEYHHWASQQLRSAARRHSAPVKFETQPLVSVICPTYKPLMADVDAAVKSVQSQTYTNWELVIVDDGSKSSELTDYLKATAKCDRRLRLITTPGNLGISDATNVGLGAAKGEWTVFFDHDDLLVPHALQTLLAAVVGSEAEAVYSDEDKIDISGIYSEPNFKPDWNYRYLLGCNYVCHVFMIKTMTLAKLGPLNRRYNGAQDHDLMLRVAEQVHSSRIKHVAEVLYHWRKTPGSTAVTIDSKGYAVTAGIQAITDHLSRRGICAQVSSIRGNSIYQIDVQPEEYPAVSIIIPFKEQISMTKRCLDSILRNTVYPKFEIILVDNWSQSQEYREFRQALEAYPEVRVITIEEPFNFSRLNNIAAATCTSPYLLFMNNDIVIEKSDWIRRLVAEYVIDRKVAVVGAKLIYPNRTIQHAGIVVTAKEIALHAHQGLREDEFGYVGRAMLSHEVTAVTAACMMVKKSTFDAVGGFDEEVFAVAYNDVDLCLKVRACGEKVVFCAEAVAEHHESLSRGPDHVGENRVRLLLERGAMLKRWGKVLEKDVHYNVNFGTGDRLYHALRELSVDEVVPAVLA